jgi:hypothetical protein
VRASSPYKKGQRFMIAIVLAMPAIMWGVPLALMAFGLPSQSLMIAVRPLAITWLIVGSIGSFLISCRKCGRSVFLRRFMISTPWPARTCSKCGSDLTTT